MFLIYVWVKKYIKICVKLFKIWKYEFKIEYQTGPINFITGLQNDMSPDGDISLSLSLSLVSVVCAWRFFSLGFQTVERKVEWWMWTRGKISKDCTVTVYGVEINGTHVWSTTSSFSTVTLWPVAKLGPRGTTLG